MNCFSNFFERVSCSRPAGDGSARVTNDGWADIAGLAATGSQEPLGHELFREAWNLRIQSPRSSVLVGIAAVEVGVKHFVVGLDPYLPSRHIGRTGWWTAVLQN